MQKGNSGKSVCTEISAEAEMNSGKYTVPDIAVQVLAAQADDIGIRGKQADSLVSDKLHEDGDHDAIGNGNGGGAEQRLACPFVLFCTDILGAEGRNGR